MHESEKWKEVAQLCPTLSHPMEPTRLLYPWGFPGKSTGVGCHCLLHLPAQFYNKKEWFRFLNEHTVQDPQLPLHSSCEDAVMTLAHPSPNCGPVSSLHPHRKAPEGPEKPPGLRLSPVPITWRESTAPPVSCRHGFAPFINTANSAKFCFRQLNRCDDAYGIIEWWTVMDSSLPHTHICSSTVLQALCWPQGLHTSLPALRTYLSLPWDTCLPPRSPSLPCFTHTWFCTQQP